MSGGIGPCSDIHLPKEESTEEAGKPPRRRFFTFRQLNVLAVMIVLSASGMVSIEDLGFVLFSIIYLYFISEAAFPQTTPPWTGSVFGQTNRTLRLYMLTAAVIGLLLPLAYIFEGGADKLNRHLSFHRHLHCRPLHNHLSLRLEEAGGEPSTAEAKRTADRVGAAELRSGLQIVWVRRRRLDCLTVRWRTGSPFPVAVTVYIYHSVSVWMIGVFLGMLLKS